VPFDPIVQLADATGRFEEVPVSWATRAKELCNTPQYNGGRVGDIQRVPGISDRSLIKVLHPTKERTVRNVDGSESKIPAYIVFISEYQGTVCAGCNWVAGKLAEDPNNQGLLRWKKNHVHKIHDVWVPVSYTKCYDEEDADTVVMETKSAWATVDAQAQEGWGNELPFSPEFMESLILEREMSGRAHQVVV
jgi:hypothetical protein